ncbi:hypothetical protein MNQ98_20125 [Paenibacillus sp. N3/727]|uniref:hypothetical protein n=1 Tax=Paenibacillus sp. N3/727 TaxID=2925845 RepID=UPI001F535A51|nr:hypothetical protein [Paenibacillus sp. N3/727]UNK16791.1 hypothetical protein MNQ98_20125 [Paenibacillus sp. N3/727]
MEDWNFCRSWNNKQHAHNRKKDEGEAAVSFSFTNLREWKRIDLMPAFSYNEIN